MIDPATIAAQNSAAIRSAWLMECEVAMTRGSWKLRLAGGGTRRKFAEAFVETVEVAQTKEAARALFEEKIRAKAIPPAVIWMIAQIVFELLWAWWQKRRNP